MEPVTSTKPPRSSDVSFAAKRPLVSIVVVTVNTPKATRACLRSVLQNTSVPFELIVINNSPASAIQRCLAAFPQIHLIQNPRNFGYAKAANQGAHSSRGKYLCFLNSDTWVPPLWMERLTDIFRLPQVGAVGPITESYSNHWPPRGVSVTEVATCLVDEAVQHWHRGRLEEVPRLGGFCFLTSREVVCRVGPFDERFFFGFDDDDYSWRLRLHGYRLLHVKSVFLHHQGGGSTRNQRCGQIVERAWHRLVAKWRPFVGEEAVSSCLRYSPYSRSAHIDRVAFRSVVDKKIDRFLASK